MYKLDLETAEEPEVNCQRLLDHRESKRIPEKISTSVSLTMLKPLTVWITTNSGKFLQMGIPDHLTCLLRNCMQVKKQQLELDMEQQTGSKLGKEFVKAVYRNPVYLIYMQSKS